MTCSLEDAIQFARGIPMMIKEAPAITKVSHHTVDHFLKTSRRGNGAEDADWFFEKKIQFSLILAVHFMKMARAMGATNDLSLWIVLANQVKQFAFGLFFRLGDEDV